MSPRHSSTEPSDSHIGDSLRPSKDQDQRPWFGSDDDASGGKHHAQPDPEYLRRPAPDPAPAPDAKPETSAKP